MNFIFKGTRAILFSDPVLDYPKEEDVSTPLAFSFVVHTQPGLFELLLHLIFRPYHSYCIYVDPQGSSAGFEHIVSCYQQIFPQANIFLSKPTQHVEWANYSLLHADLQCLRNLLSTNR